MESNLVEHFWQADEYHHNSSAQQNAAHNLLAHIDLKGNEHLLDIGCGDGKITASIANKLKHGTVLGIDLSPEMIAFAKNTFPKNHHTNLSFMIQDAQQIKYSKKFDVVFSSFAIQWIKDKNSFFTKVVESLKSGGQLALTIPLDISLILEKAIQSVISQKQWTSYLKSFPKNWYFPDPDNLRKQLQSCRLKIDCFDNVTQEVIFLSRESFERYVFQWLPYLRALPDNLKQIFFNQIIDKHFEMVPLPQSGKVHYRFSRVDIVARLLPNSRISNQRDDCTK